MILVFFCAIINKRKFRTSIYLLPEKKKINYFYASQSTQIWLFVKG